MLQAVARTETASRAPTREAHASGVGFCVSADTVLESVADTGAVLLAYIDEIGEPGAFVSPDHPRFRTSPAFGYAGFVIDADYALDFGRAFTEEKRRLFRVELEQAEHPGRWERKGADIFHKFTLERQPQQFRVFNALVRQCRQFGGRLFFYADEKSRGTPGQVRVEPEDRETAAMRETLNRIARHAQSRDSNVMVMLDQVNEKTRAKRLPIMYSHVLGRAADHPEMRHIVEPPMHIDSVLSSNIQFADWVAACVSRALENQLLAESRHGSVILSDILREVRSGSMWTYESKIHLRHRGVADLCRAEIFSKARPLFPRPEGHLVNEHLDPAVVEKMRGIAEASMRQARTSR